MSRSYELRQIIERLLTAHKTGKSREAQKAIAYEMRAVLRTMPFTDWCVFQEDYLYVVDWVTLWRVVASMYENSTDMARLDT